MTHSVYVVFNISKMYTKNARLPKTRFKSDIADCFEWKRGVLLGNRFQKVESFFYFFVQFDSAPDIMMMQEDARFCNKCWLQSQKEEGSRNNWFLIAICFSKMLFGNI